MESASDDRRIFSFSVFELDTLTGELRKSGMRLKLAGHPVQVLQLLLEHPNELVSREELRRRIWSESTYVDYDLALKKAVSRVRDALGDSADNPRFVETIPRLAYRFIGAVRSGPAPVTTGQLSDSDSSTDSLAGSQRSQPRLRVALLTVSGIIALSVISVLVLDWTGRLAVWHPVKASSHKVMLAVLPLDNLSGDSNQDYFSDGMTEELITQLGRVTPLRLGVIARASAMQYKRPNKNIAQIGKELGVDYVLEGSARYEGGQVRITAQLIQVRDQTHVWAQEYDRPMSGILGMQAEVARDVTQAIRLNLPGEASMNMAGPVNPEAHEAFLKGKFYWAQLNCPGFLKARDYYQQAISKNERYAMAYAGLADADFKIADFHCVPDWQRAVAEAKGAAVKAIYLDENLAEAHASLGVLLILYDWDWPNAEKEYKRAIELNPNYETAHSWYGMGLVAMGRQNEGRMQLEIAKQLDPVALLTNYIQSMGYYAMRRYDVAVSVANMIIEMYPGFTDIHGFLGSVYEAQGRENEAVSEYLKAEAV